ncbi:MAG: 5-bromo-4-chloroindolyl phosphate hydrolysis family protein [Clostridia bacterium]|nr:5-bromo-4-chloroindolyl phosphate hydrolysis family protein [Clostridia bacterium]
MNDNKAPIGRRYKEVPVKSAIPIWCAATVWLFAAVFIPFYSVWHIIIIALISAAVGITVKLVLPKETRQVEVPFASGNFALDGIVQEIDRANDALENVRKSISADSPSAADKIYGICEQIEKIRQALINSPDDITSVRRFINYYLPTTVNLAEKYQKALEAKSEGENAQRTLSSIEAVFDQIKQSFEKQHDALFADDAMDASAEIKVLETMLQRDNLK